MKSPTPKLIKRLLGSKPLFIALLLLFLAVVGPALVSAKSNVLVLLGIVIGLALGKWGFSLFFKGSK